LCDDDPDSYASGSIAAGWASHARQIEVYYPDKKRYHGTAGWELGLEANNLTSIKKVLLLRSLIMDASCIIVVRDQGK
jgi:hypothetical protein